MLERAKNGPSTAICVAWARIAADLAPAYADPSISAVIRSPPVTPGTSSTAAMPGKAPGAVVRSRSKPASATARSTRFQ